MELVKNVFFNTDKLTPNIDIKISYTGKFYQDDAETVYLHYGFGKSWIEAKDIEMKKTELGFQAEITLIDSETFNFCFKNDKGEWDNNEDKNYIFDIEHPETSLTVVDKGSSLITTRRLRKSYIIKKKIRISIYKVLTYLPKLITGNYKRKTREY